MAKQQNVDIDHVADKGITIMRLNLGVWNRLVITYAHLSQVCRNP